MTALFPPPAPPRSGTASELKREIVERAQAFGFDSCKITAAAPPRYGNEFREWLREGAGGEMDWLSRGEEKRCDPQQVLPGVRSVIVVALNYWQGHRPLDVAGGRIARYAWGDDYHDIMLPKLEELSAFLADHGGAQKYYVDTGPILERDHAAEAGIGWHGKSTMLVDPKLGTWFFLAEILTTLALPPDAPQPARCGTCTRCITACPTGAITDAHRLDARRCISYLTIELKGSIPLELRPLIGDRIYGCDDCLDACPGTVSPRSHERPGSRRAPRSACRCVTTWPWTTPNFAPFFVAHRSNGSSAADSCEMSASPWATRATRQICPRSIEPAVIPNRLSRNTRFGRSSGSGSVRLRHRESQREIAQS